MEVYLLQAPYIYIAFDRVCGLGNALDVYWVGDRPKAAIAVRKGSFHAIFRVEWSNECLCAVHVSRNDTSLLLVSLYCQFADEIDHDINSLNRVVDGNPNTPLLTGMDANASSALWHSKDLSTSRERDAKGDMLAEYIVRKGLLVFNEPSIFFTFAGPVGNSDINVTLTNTLFEQYS